MANDNGMFDPYGLSDMLTQYLSNLQGQQPDLANNTFARETKEEIEKNVKNVARMTEEEIKKSVKQLENLFTSVFGRSSNAHKFFEMFGKELEQLSKQMSISTTLFSNLSTSAGSLLMQLSRAGNMGMYNLNKKGLDKNLPAQQLMSALLPEMGKKFDSAIDKLLNFFVADKDSRKTRMRQFREDLVDGLAKSKFFGGAIMDLIKLGALFVGSWLKDKGTIGKVLAVALIAAAPVIGAAIALAISGAMVTGIVKVMGFIGKLFFTPIRWLGRGLFSLMGKLLTAVWATKTLGGLKNMFGVSRAWQAGKTLASASNMALAPGATGFAVDAMLAGKLTQNIAPKAGLSAVSGPLKGILGVATKILPWVLRLGKLFNIVGWIWLGIEAIVGIVKWWRGRKDKKEGARGKGSNIDIADVSYQNYGDVSSSLGQDSVSNATLAGHRVTSGFGMRVHPVYGDRRMHTGIDLAYNKGDSINALMGGEIIFAGQKGGYGNAVVVRDKLGTEHLYGHLDSINEDILSGKRRSIKRGDYLGAAGKTGTATGVHLHYETKLAKGGYTDPIEYLRAHESLSLKLGEKKSNYADKFTQNVVAYWDSQGKDKGFLHSKAHDYAKLAEQFKHEYVQDVAKISKKGYINGEIRDMRYLEAYRSQEAKDYANKKIAEFVDNAKMEANAKSIGISTSLDQKAEILDIGTSATDQAREQWGNINRRFKEDAEKTVVIPEDKQPILDFSGTDTCSKILQNTLNAQQQAFLQQP